MIYLVWGKPKHGKTYWAVRRARKVLKNRSKTVFSNFPIISEWGCSKEWKSELAAENIQNSLIIIDEAYMDFNSRNFSKFTPEEHAFFSLNGHNGNDIVVIAHSPARLDTVIREMCNEFIYVDATFIPFTYRTVWFTIESYLDMESISMRHMSKDAIYYKQRYPFKWAVANSYDYKFYRNDEYFDPDIYPTWDEVVNIKTNLYGKKVSLPETLYFCLTMLGFPLTYPLHKLSKVRLYHKLVPTFYKEVLIGLLLHIVNLLNAYQLKIARSKVNLLVDVSYNDDFLTYPLNEQKKLLNSFYETCTSLQGLTELDYFL